MNAVIVLGIVSVLVGLGFVVGFGVVIVIGLIARKRLTSVKEVYVHLASIPVYHRDIELQIPAIYRGVNQDVITAHGVRGKNLIELSPGNSMSPEEFLENVEDQLSPELKEILFVSCFPASKKAGQYKQWSYKFLGDVEEELWLNTELNDAINVKLLVKV